MIMINFFQLWSMSAHSTTISSGFVLLSSIVCWKVRSSSSVIDSVLCLVWSCAYRNPPVFALTHHIPTVYNWMGIKCRSGRVVMNSMKSMRSITFGEKKKTFLDTVNEWVSQCVRPLTHRFICWFHVLHFLDHTTLCAWVFCTKPRWTTVVKIFASGLRTSEWFSAMRVGTI